MRKKNSHCSYCGQVYPVNDPWPRTCGGCGEITYLNPLPVAVVLLPVGERGVLIIRRNIEPGWGQLALPGGYMDVGETWQQTASRELWEETGIQLPPDEFHELRVRSNTPPDQFIMIFGRGPRLEPETLPPFVPNSETQERLVVTEPVKLCFPTHERILREYYASL